MLNKDGFRERIIELHEEGLRLSGESDYFGALVPFRECLELARQGGNTQVINHCHWHCASELKSVGRLKESLAHLLPLMSTPEYATEVEEDYLGLDMTPEMVRFAACAFTTQIGRSLPLSADCMLKAIDEMKKLLPVCDAMMISVWLEYGAKALIDIGKPEEALRMLQKNLNRVTDEERKHVMQRVAADSALAAGKYELAERYYRTAVSLGYEGSLWATDFRRRKAMQNGEHCKAIANAREAMIEIFYESRREDKIRAIQGAFEALLLCGETEEPADILNRLISMTNRRAGVERYRLWLSLADWHLYLAGRSSRGRHPERAKLALQHAGEQGRKIDSRWGHVGCAGELALRDEKMMTIIRNRQLQRIKRGIRPLER